MADFNLAYQNTMISEGGYSNVAADRGGETYMGISRKNHPHWLGWPVIDSYKGGVYSKTLSDVLFENSGLQKLVKTFYKESFWPAAFEQLDQDIANELFDTAVNQGLGSAVKYFQATLNILNRNQKDYPNVAADGAIGPLTLACYGSLLATKSYPARSYNKIVKVILKWMNFFQMKRYIDIVDKAEDQEEFIFGWTERVI